MSQSSNYYDLLDAFGQPECPVCRVAAAALHRAFESLDYEAVGDPGIQERLQVGLGFCNLHAWQWLQQAHVLSTAVIYRQVLARLAAGLSSIVDTRVSPLADFASRFGGRPDQTGLEPLMPAEPCFACAELRTIEKDLARAMTTLLKDTAARDRYQASDGLCLPHLRQLLTTNPDRTVRAVLREKEQRRQEQLTAQLQEIIRKHDYRFSHETYGEERGAQERALRHVIGDPGFGMTRAIGPLPD